MNKDYPYIVKPVDKKEYDVNYVVEFIGFPGITGGGDTTDEALEMYIEVLIAEGKNPSTDSFRYDRQGNAQAA